MMNKFGLMVTKGFPKSSFQIKGYFNNVMD